MGQIFARLYNVLDSIEIVAIAEYNDERRKTVGERFGVKVLYKGAKQFYTRFGEVPGICCHRSLRRELMTVHPGKK